MGKPCQPYHGDFVEGCSLCRKYRDNPDVWNRTKKPIRIKGEPTKLDHCIYFGEPTGEKKHCGPCGGNVQLRLFTCAIHGSCTLATKTDGVACCKGCNDCVAPQTGGDNGNS